MKKKLCILSLAASCLILLFACGALRTHRLDWPAMLFKKAVETVSWHFSSHNSEVENRISDYAENHGFTLSDYPKSLISMMERNPETEDFVLSYPIEHQKKQIVDLSEYADCSTVPLLMQWDTRWGYKTYAGEFAGLSACGPVCLSMVAIYLTGDTSLTPDYLIDFAEKNGYGVWGQGSSWTLISEGGEKLGLDVTELPLDEDRIVRNLEVGNPIICVMGPGDFTATGHFIVLTGYENGAFTVNDPNSFENSRKTWTYAQIKEQIDNIWAIRY